MELHNQLVRRAITIAINRAIENMQNDLERSTRNLIDLGLLFTKSHRLRSFFETAKKILANPDNSYHQLIKRVINTVDVDTVKTVGINLGYNQLNYGTKILRKMQDNFCHTLPWLLAFQSNEYDGIFYKKIADYIAEGQALGIYSYLFIIDSIEDLPPIIDIVNRNEECVFMLKIPPQLVTEESAQLLAGLKNMVISVKILDEHKECISYLSAFQLLQKYSCLYGFHILFITDNASTVCSREFLQTMLDYGCAFGSYLTNVDDKPCQQLLESFVISKREGKGLPILVFDWLSDTKYVGEAILSGSDYLILNSKGEASLGHRTDKRYVEGSLKNIIQSIMPKIAQAI